MVGKEKINIDVEGKNEEDIKQTLSTYKKKLELAMDRIQKLEQQCRV